MRTLQDQFISASGNGDLKMVEYLVKNGANVTALDNSAVIWASIHGHLKMVEYLVKNGADVTDQDNSAIFWTNRNGHLKIVDFLLKNGASMDKLAPKYKEYFRMKRAYSRWRRVYLRNWIRKVLIPLYYSPQFQGGIQAKLALQAVVTRHKKDLEAVVGST